MNHGEMVAALLAEQRVNDCLSQRNKELEQQMSEMLKLLNALPPEVLAPHINTRAIQIMCEQCEDNLSCPKAYVETCISSLRL